MLMRTANQVNDVTMGRKRTDTPVMKMLHNQSISGNHCKHYLGMIHSDFHRILIIGGLYYGMAAKERYPPETVGFVFGEEVEICNVTET